MNQRKIKLITISILIILSSCSYIVNSVENPINKGIVDYKDYEYITFTSPYEVNLSYITSEIPSSALTFIKTGYYPLVNETKYPGSYEVEFNASHLSSGVYIAVLQTEETMLTRTMLLIK